MAHIIGSLIGIVAGILWLLLALIPMNEYYWQRYKKLPPLWAGSLSFFLAPIMALFWVILILKKRIVKEKG
jgi:hypothetical protein